MSLRNTAVSLVGLKNLGSLQILDRFKAEADYTPGDKVSIFSLIKNTPDEVLFEDKDKHLEVVLSVHRTTSSSGMVVITVTTVVHIYNMLGRIYMLPVTPIHKVIVPSLLKIIGSIQNAA